MEPYIDLFNMYWMLGCFIGFTIGNCWLLFKVHKKLELIKKERAFYENRLSPWASK